MKFVLSKEKLVALMQASSKLCEEVLITCDKDGWHLKAVDVANVACVMILVPSSEFDHYELPREFGSEEGQLALDLLSFSDKLKVFDTGDPVAMSVEDGKLEARSGCLTYKLSLLDPIAIRKPPRIPTLDLPAKVVLDGATFQKSVKALTILTDVVRFEIVEGDDGEYLFVMTGKGDIDSASLKISASTLKGFKPGKASSRFSSDYLQDIAKSVKGADEVGLELGVDYPLILNAKVQGVEASYIVAPRVESD